LLAETRKIFEAHFSLETTIKDTLKNLTGLEEAYIFGSYAKGKLSRESDIDLLLIGSHDPLAAKRLLLPIQKKLGREINALDFLPEEITKRRAAKDGLIMEIFSNKNIKVI
jgi:predicted nucleotidyltransferase